MLLDSASREEKERREKTEKTGPRREVPFVAMGPLVSGDILASEL